METWQATLIGAIIGGVIVFVSSFLVQKWTQERIWRKERTLRAIDTMYGPLLSEMSMISELLKRFDPISSFPMKWTEIRHHHLYFTIPQKLRGELEAFYDRLEGYRILYEGAKGSIDRVVRDAMRSILSEEAIAPPRDLTINYRVFVVHQFVTMISLRDALLKGKTPRQLLEEKGVDVKGAETTVLVGGYGYPDIETINRLCEVALKKIQEDLLFQEMRNRNSSLLQDVQEIIKKLKNFIEEL